VNLSELRAIAAEVLRSFRTLPVLLVMSAMVDYRVVHDDGWPWWLPIILTAAAVAAGALLAWHKIRRVRKGRLTTTLKESP
jgi:CHASE2 domain-containing sensor protein